MSTLHDTVCAAPQGLDLTGNMWRIAQDDRPRRRPSDSSAQASSAEAPEPVGAEATAAAAVAQLRPPTNVPSSGAGWPSANRPVRPRLEPQHAAACVRPSRSVFNLRTAGPKAASGSRCDVSNEPEACSGLPCTCKLE